jgi:putative SOS response-associated peptidase YedK
LTLIEYDEEMMCGRFSITPNREGIEARFGARFDAAWFQARYNAAPSQALPVILNTAPDMIFPLRWGLKPAWAQKLGRREGIINVRAETLRDRPTFKKDLLEHRCLVLADSFYEWRKDRKHKTPFRILLKTEEPFAFAGIWEENKDSDGQPIQTFAIITTEANTVVAEIHNRMPVVLTPEEERGWLADDKPVRELLHFLRPYPAELMRAYQVSTLVNSASMDQPELIKPER